MPISHSFTVGLVITKPGVYHEAVTDRFRTFQRRPLGVIRQAAGIILFRLSDRKAKATVVKIINNP